MISFLIGHRGCGKTALVNRLQAQSAGGLFYDLDREIEKHSGLSIIDIFKTHGEDNFRGLEQEVLNQLLSENPSKDVLISLGAGFQGELPDSARCVWVKSLTDKDGRIFRDRPRLTKGNPFDEYMEKYQHRHPKYQALCDEQVIVCGAYNEITPADQLMFLEPTGSLGGALTLLPENFKTQKSWDTFINRRLNWGIDLLEVRDDLLSKEQQQMAFKNIPQDKILYSYRTEQEKKNNYQSDWALELGAPQFTPSIVSLHKREKSLEDIFEDLEQYGDSHIKLAIEIHNMDELLEGHEWHLKDPQNRSFLPRSKDGRWSWYRLLHKNKMKLNFFRESQGSSLDQPLFYDWANAPQIINEFAAIMGSPVYHSYTPEEHKDFFLELGQPVLRLELTEEDFTSSILSQLRSLGLSHAAVTSPLKEEMFLKTEFVHESLTFLESANTIIWNDEEKKFLSTNTDIVGLNKLFEDIDKQDVSVWGGGGTRSSLMYTLPQAAQYSMREQTPVHLENDNPKVVVWAVGRKRHKNFPPQSWKPELVVDLNYTLDSPGLEYADKVGAQYRSGIIMFRAQAQAQRDFWTKQAVVDPPGEV